VRPWLVVIGMVFLTLALGSAATLYFAIQGTSTVSTTVTSPPTFSVGAHGTQVLFFSGSNGSSERFSLSWHSTGPLSVQLEEPPTCAASCGDRLLLWSWPSNLTGAWAGNGPFTYPLVCVLQNLLSRTANVTLTARVVATTPTHPSLGFVVIVGAGAGALFIVGGLAIFLGLFLRGNPYGLQAAPVSRSAEDVEELTRDERPGH